MPSGSAGRRYAQAIFDLARQENKLERWAADLESLNFALSQPQVQSYLENPKTSRDSKAQFLSKVLGTEIGPEALNLAQLLVRRERQGYIGAINQEFIRRWNQLRGIVVAEVITAVPVNDKEKEEIRAKLSAYTGKQVTVETKVDPDIIGGMIAQIGDTLIDGSVRTRLQNLRKQLA